MNYFQVEYAVTAAKYRSISAAANHLCISQSALSQQVSKLEKELGYPLFIRESHGLKVTFEGELFFKQAEAVVGSWKNFCSWTEERSVPKEQLSICLGYCIFTNNLMDSLISFFESRPDLTVSFVKCGDSDFLSDIESGHIDVAFERIPSNAARDDLFVKDLFYERMCVLMGKNNPLASRTFLSPAELTEMSVVSGPKYTTIDQRMHQEFSSSVVKESSYRSGSIEVIINILRSGKFVTFGAESLGQYYNIAAVPVFPVKKTPLQFICKRSALERESIRSLLGYMTEICSGTGFTG